MEFFTQKILEILVYNTNTLDMTTSDIIIDDYFLENMKSKLQYNKNENNRYFYKLLTYLCKLKSKNFNIYIKCDTTNCKKCISKKNKLRYNANIPNIPYIINKNYKKQQNDNKNEINSILSQIHIPSDIIKNIDTYTDDNCIYKTRITKILNNVIHYNIFYNIFIRNNKLHKYFRLDKFCEFNSDCVMCKIIFYILMEAIYQVNHYSNFISCKKSPYLNNIPIYGFTCYEYYILNGASSKTIQLNDYDIFELSDDENIIFFSDSDTDTETNGGDVGNNADPPHIDFWD